MNKKFEGRVALVTGAASGIGKVTAQIFAGEGAKVIVSTDKNIKGGEETVRLIKEAGGEATFIKCNVTRAKRHDAQPNSDEAPGTARRYGRRRHVALLR
jgi:NAD(P)-dependent dehydrogenase (short-subunit alcohol dehydrogenase family)